MNASVVAIFVFLPDVRRLQAASAIGGGIAGGHMLGRMQEHCLRFFVITIGIVPTTGLFLHVP